MSKKQQKELTVDEHNALVYKEIEKLESQIIDLKKTFKSESLKPQATLQECLSMNKKAEKLTAVKDKVKPKTNSL